MPAARLGRVQRLSSIAAPLAALVIVAACLGTTGPPSSVPLPEPTCGGIKIKIDGALPCDAIVDLAAAALRERAPQQRARGVTAIDVSLATCPRNEIPQQIDCGTEEFAQLVTFTFAVAAPGGPIEPSLTVAVAPVSGRILGIANPLIR